MKEPLNESARLVIIGGGSVGCSAAYHLSKMGLNDVVVIDQGPLFRDRGSVPPIALAFQTNYSRTMCKFAQYGVSLFRDLNKSGEKSWYEVGGLEVAYTKGRWEDLKRKLGAAKAWGLESRLISPSEAKEKVPILDETKIYGGYFCPSDGALDVVPALEAMGNFAKGKGLRFYGDTRVTGFEVSGRRVKAVLTDRGRVATEMVLSAGGIWGPLLGSMVGLNIPLTPCEHQVMRVGKVKELAGLTATVHPILRHQDRDLYFVQIDDSYVIGSYLHEPILVDPRDLLLHEEAPVVPWVKPFMPSMFNRAWQAATELLPPLRNSEPYYKIHGIFSFTPDGNPLLGEHLDVKGFWVAEAVWITHAGGVGRAMAEWIVDGTPSLDLRECDLHRFHEHAFTSAYVKARGAQQYREVYDIIHPMQQIQNPRNLRLTPFHQRLKEQGAVFFEGVGWERPQWFEANRRMLEDYDVPNRSGWEARYWSRIEGAEHLATRERVAMYDLTPFTKIEVTGEKALGYLQKLTTNQVDQPVGRVIYTSMLNQSAGIMCDVTVTRHGPNDFTVITGGSVGPHDIAWMRRHMPLDGSVHVRDVTSAYCSLGLWGPKARDTIEKVSPDDYSDRAFPYYSARRISIESIPAFALRVSYAGELGWELYTPTEYGVKLWDTLWGAGEQFGIVAGGMGAFDSLRLEKGYRLWGADIHTEYNNYEAGLGFIVKPDKGDFIGRDALLQLRDRGLSRKLSCMVLDDGKVVMGKEPILDGESVLGYVTSANYGYTVGKGIVYGYLPIDYAVEGKRVDVYYFGNRYGASVAKDPLLPTLHVR
ncbi:MAG TPA: FAD-dependent oxidoreductase [Candidatus Acidoferrales bacterium]|nr:FAD-dependent oxidoreductase [Candidatus Acidoferrales bacterium]